MGDGTTIRGRYVVLGKLGRGGMATIYRVRDLTCGRELALKQQEIPSEEALRAEAVAALEREYQVLAQLSHPRIVQVFDYGLDPSGPFYTMELLDGGDVLGRAPMPWQELCALAQDVCSALALLHSRRLVHRDVSPRNIRCTKDGQAKLIDFGAMVPMGPAGAIVGTPQVVAPEVLQRANLDARTDLFSLGVTLYFALTQKLPFAARRFDDLAQAWTVKPKAPSQHVAEIPAALDALLLSLLSIDPAMRPRAAFEVMERLSVIVGERVEPVSVSSAYLSAPRLVGRDELVHELEQEMTSAFGGRMRSVLIRGELGVGRSRMLDACGISGKTLGALVLRVNGRAGTNAPFRVIQQLLAQFHEASVKGSRLSSAELEFAFQSSGHGSEPSGQGDDDTLARSPDVSASRAGAGDQRFMKYVRLLLRASRTRPVVLAIDDIDAADPASVAVLSALATHASSAPMCVVATAESERNTHDHQTVEEFARRSRLLTLAPLTRAETEGLLESVFGDVANLGALSEGIHAIAHGNPRASMDLARHLVDQGLVFYERGAWTLPATLDRAVLPKTAEDAVLNRIGALTPVARWLAEAQALASHRAFVHEEYMKLRPDLSAAEINGALMTLISAQVLIGDGRVHVLAHRGFNDALSSALSAEQRSERHRALISLYEGRVTLAAVRHAFLAGLEAEAFAALAPTLQGFPEALDLEAVADLGAAEIAATFEQALTAAERGGRSLRELNELRRWLAVFAVRSDDAYYFRVAAAWCARLRLDSGYDDWLALGDMDDPQARVGKALALATARHQQRPEGERVYAPDEAIERLAHYVGISVAIASSRIDIGILEDLPALLEPFAGKGLMASLWKNAIATREVSCRARPEHARTYWLAVYAELQQVPEERRAFSEVFRRAIAFGIGSSAASMGMKAAEEQALILEADPVQRINALYLRSVVRLQQGDWDGAQRLRKRAELARIGARGRQMFSSLTWVELVACAMARDFAGLKDCRDRVRSLAQRAPGWIPHAHLAQGYLMLIRDDLAGAAAAFEATLALVAPSADKPYPLHTAWTLASAALVEALVGLERYEQARTLGEAALATCRALEIGVSAHGISRALALAEAKLGHFAEAADRLEKVIQNQCELEVSGLHLGASYEARARVAIWQGDAAAVERFASLTAHEYRHGEGSPLGARYERLMNEARGMGHHNVQSLSEASGLASTALRVDGTDLDMITETSREPPVPRGP